ncbi:MAG: hypothetical protein ACYSR4_08635, partial [Planctomycetota bacterium]
KEKRILVLGGSQVLHSHPLLQRGGEFVHEAHLKNFFDAIRGRAELTCPGEVAYETAVAVLRANAAISQSKKLSFKPEEFKV